MNVPLITMPKHDAEVAFAEYREAVKQRHTEEDHAIMVGYREMAKGRAVINVEDAIRDAGMDEYGRPRLAICRADGHFCWFDHQHDGPRFSMSESPRWRATSTYIKLRRDLFGPGAKLTKPGRAYSYQVRAVVPSIPPRLRPKSAYSNFHILGGGEGFGAGAGAVSVCTGDVCEAVCAEYRGAGASARRGGRQRYQAQVKAANIMMANGGKE
jgi:hypothetical protein